MTTEKNKKSFGISPDDKARLIKKMRERTTGHVPSDSRLSNGFSYNVQKDLCTFKNIPGYKKLHIHRAVATQMGIMNPFFLCHEGLAKDTTIINGNTFLNFSTYDYLDLNGSDLVNEAAAKAIKNYGTSASASRLVAGERPVHLELEKALADFYGVDDCITFVSGHATNIWVLCQLFGKNDLILYDSLIHNSIVTGSQFSGAKRIAFPHNNYARLKEILHEHRKNHKRAVIITEGLFGMDGDIPDLPGLVDLKKKHGCFLMVDEAHSLGTLGLSGRGIAEHFNMSAGNIDIIMGTLSKTLCGCGGFIAGKNELIEYLKFTAPGFVYSVGMSPVLAAASLEALKQLQARPEQVKKLQNISSFFLSYAKSLNLDTGKSLGTAVIPIIVRNSLVAGILTTYLFQNNINVMPIIYPAVEENSARLRFFLSAAHSKKQVKQALDITAQEIIKARELAQKMTEKDSPSL